MYFFPPFSVGCVVPLLFSPRAHLSGYTELGNQSGLTHVLEDGPDCGLQCFIFLHAASPPSGLDWVVYMVFSISEGRSPSAS